ncbi:type I-F CRISPR-associated protein Csy3 [Psychrobacter sp. SZ93C1]|uniref:type I-F CRISPR-associated protein Csy3 n=1 Tax=Psychrobacter sp. SZ93C1 TaxID=2792058 RepID=UPI0018CF2A92|nr:type I-F CRISPR-associated protein Csy3 [Psychrobacter sp. SZ93C1]MBH0065087.1 type I-F CRISPR-associated protein Csy3 [Psychrobacter sp. SZ93C1]
MSKIALKTASVLAFERNLDVSDAYLWQKDSQGSSENKTASPVIVKEKSVRGTISNRLKNAITNDPAKLDAETEKANLQKVDSASLDENNDTLIARFSLKVLPFTGKPNVCNDQDYQQALEQVVTDYIDAQGVDELARRYAINVLNARWLWRNRVGTESIKVTVKCNEQTVTVDDAKAYGLKGFDSDDANIKQVADWVKAGLNGEAFIILYVEAQAIIGYGQEVYPSQELILDTGSKKSKVLYRVSDCKGSENNAGMHSQKISNAIRTIDDWYPNAEFPIAVEPYGAVTTLGTAFRQPKEKMDFYSLFDNWVLKGDAPDVNQQHYVMGVLIRGGVFGASGKE